MQIFKTASLGVGAALLVALARPSFGADAPPAPPRPLVPGTVVSSPENTGTRAPAENALSPVPQNASPRPSSRRQSAGASARGRLAVAPNGADDPMAATVAKELADAHIDETVARAVADAHIAETVTKTLADAHLDETVAKAVADAHVGETVAKALADAHLDEKIASALKRAQPEIDAAIAREQRLLQRAQQQALPPSP